MSGQPNPDKDVTKKGELSARVSATSTGGTRESHTVGCKANGKITVRWLIAHLPISKWIGFCSVLVSVFGLGMAIGRTSIVQDSIASVFKNRDRDLEQFKSPEQLIAGLNTTSQAVVERKYLGRWIEWEVVNVKATDFGFMKSGSYREASIEVEVDGSQVLFIFEEPWVDQLNRVSDDISSTMRE
jgi:hypothetical protein